MSDPVIFLRYVYQIIEAAPELERLKIAIDQSVLSILKFDDPEYLKFIFNRPMILKSLALNLAYDEDFSWEGSVAWEELEELSLKDMKSVPNVGRRFNALRSLHVSRAADEGEEALKSPAISATYDLALNCPNLTELMLVNFARVVKSNLLEYIGPKLKLLSTFDYRETRVLSLNRGSHYLHLNDIQTIGAFCPSIKTLGFAVDDIDSLPVIVNARSSLEALRQVSTNGWFISILNGVAAMFPELKELYLYSSLRTKELTGSLAVNLFDLFDGLRA
ncbi:MAG: hypothetical protein Q9160_006687 [Pyrenula sp. 1 TL-2023]